MQEIDTKQYNIVSQSMIYQDPKSSAFVKPKACLILRK